MKKGLYYLLIGLIAFSVSGCATMMRGDAGTTTPVTVRTEPSDATIVVDGLESTSPAVFTLKRKKNYQIIVKKQGYKSVIVNLRSKIKEEAAGTSFLTNTAAFGWWTLGIGTAVGMLTDAVTGSMVDLDTDGIFIKLTPGEGEIVIEASDLLPGKKPKKSDSETDVPE